MTKAEESQKLKTAPSKSHFSAGLSLPPVKEIDMRVYFKAALSIFGNLSMAEGWLNANRFRLSGKTRRGNKQRRKEAKREIYKLLGKQR
jgi:hypothetical protein